MFGGLMACPMLIRIVVGRSWGQGAQHSQSPQSTFAHYPGLTVVMPSSSQAILDMRPLEADQNAAASLLGPLSRQALDTILDINRNRRFFVSA